LNISSNFEDPTCFSFNFGSDCFDPNLVVGKWLEVTGSEFHASHRIDDLLDLCVIGSDVLDVNMISSND
jgi:hypothetical protein